MALAFKDIRIRKSEFVAKTQFLCYLNDDLIQTDIGKNLELIF